MNKGLSLSGWRVVVGCTADAEVTSGSVLQVWFASILPSVCSLTVCSAHYATDTMLSALPIFTHSGLRTHEVGIAVIPCYRWEHGGIERFVNLLLQRGF